MPFCLGFSPNLFVPSVLGMNISATTIKMLITGTTNNNENQPLLFISLNREAVIEKIAGAINIAIEMDMPFSA